MCGLSQYSLASVYTPTYDIGVLSNRHSELALQFTVYRTLTDLEDSREPEDSVSLLLRLLELRYGEDDGESSM